MQINTQERTSQFPVSTSSSTVVPLQHLVPLLGSLDGQPHPIWVPTVFGYTGGSWGAVDVKVLEVYPGTKAADTLGLAELDATASNHDGF